MVSISTLTPNTFRLQLQFKVVELVLSLQTKHEPTDSTLHVYEYLIADESACIILNTKKALDVYSIYEIKDGHTRVVEGCLRLYSDTMTPLSISLPNIDTQNNMSLVRLERKI